MRRNIDTVFEYGFVIFLILLISMPFLYHGSFEKPVPSKDVQRVYLMMERNNVFWNKEISKLQMQVSIQADEIKKLQKFHAPNPHYLFMEEGK